MEQNENSLFEEDEEQANEEISEDVEQEEIPDDSDEAEGGEQSSEGDEGQEGELSPWVARRIHRERRKGERATTQLEAEKESLIRENEELKSLYQQQQHIQQQPQNFNDGQNAQQQDFQQQRPFMVTDPRSGQKYWSNTPAGQDTVRYVEGREVEKQRAEIEQYDAVKKMAVEKFDAAYENAIDNDPEFENAIIKHRKNGIIPDSMVEIMEFISPDKSVRLLKEISKKEKDLSRLSKLHQVEMAGELSNYLYELGVQDGLKRKPTNSPAAPSRFGRSTSKTSNSFLDMSIEELKSVAMGKR